MPPGLWLTCTGKCLPASIWILRLATHYRGEKVHFASGLHFLQQLHEALLLIHKNSNPRQQIAVIHEPLFDSWIEDIQGIQELPDCTRLVYRDIHVHDGHSREVLHQCGDMDTCHVEGTARKFVGSHRCPPSRLEAGNGLIAVRG